MTYRDGDLKKRSLSISQQPAPAPDARAGGRRFIFWRMGDHPPFLRLLSYLRWIIPLLIALITSAYVVFEQTILQGYSPLAPHVLRTLAFGLIGPALSWFLLNWSMQVAQAEAQAQEALAFRNRELAALDAIAQVTSQSLDLHSILDTALQKMIELMDVQAGEVRVREGDRLVLRARCGMWDTVDPEGPVAVGQCVCGQCVQAARTLTIENLPLNPTLINTACSREGFRSIVCVPMKTKGQVIGVILLGHRDRDAIAFPDQHILTAIGYKVAVAVENSRLYEQAHRRAVHLETASLLGQRMTSLLDLDSLLAEVVRLIRVKFGFYHTHLFLVDEQAREVVLKQASGPCAESIISQGLRLKIGLEGITGWVAHTGQTVVCNDVSREPRYWETELLPETQAELAVPLRVGSRIIGVLDVQSNRRDSFDKEDVTVLQILGNQIGIAIRNAQLYQETKHRYEAMKALHETSLDMIAQLDRTALLEALLRRGAQLLGADAGTLFLLNASRDLLCHAASYNSWRDLSRVTLKPGEGAMGRVIQSGDPLIVNDYEHWPERSQVFDGSPETRLISVPLKWENRIIGAINILADPERREFDGNDAWLLSQFADLAAIAVANAELHAQITEFNQELERKVAVRSHELREARDEIAEQAEQLRSMLAKSLDVQEEERARIARDMHDGVIQLVNAARYELHAGKVLGGSNVPRAVQAKIDTAYQVLEEAEKEMRRVIYDLHPAVLDATGLAPALQKYARRFASLSGIACDMEVRGTPYRLPGATEIAVFRMVEEALQNVAVHATAGNATVRLDYGPELFCFWVQDDGIGFDYAAWMAERRLNHLGLLGMQERIQNLGGKMIVRSDIGRGTRVAFELPIVQEEVLA